MLSNLFIIKDIIRAPRPNPTAAGINTEKFKQLKKDTKVSLIQKKIGNLLFSLTLSSPLKSLTSVFEMGTGVSSLLSLPIKYREIIL